jgi:hypothetical protein
MSSAPLVPTPTRWNRAVDVQAPGALPQALIIRPFGANRVNKLAPTGARLIQPGAPPLASPFDTRLIQGTAPGKPLWYEINARHRPWQAPLVRFKKLSGLA